MRLLAVLFFIILASCCHGQLPAKIRLATIFPVDSITKIRVSNFTGTHSLSENELAKLKALLKNAVIVGLTAKPGHITLEITLTENCLANPGFTYVTSSGLHFENAKDRLGQPFQGTVILPEIINFDNYR